MILYSKYLIVFIFACTCIGCAGSMSNYKGKGGPFTIDTQDKILYDSYILSIRDSGLVVVQSDNGHSFSSDSNAFYLPNRSIKYITHRGLSGLDVGGAIGGYFIGGTAIVLLGMGASYVSGSDAPIRATFLLAPWIGIIGGGLLFAPQSTFDITKFNDRELLFLLCKYCRQEPDFINAIK